MPDEQHPLPIALGGELRQEMTHPLCDLPITLSVGKGGADCGQTCRFHFCTWTPFKVAVVTLTQPCVLQDGDRAAREDETSRIIGPPGVGRKDDIEVLVSIARAQDRLRVFRPWSVSATS